MKAIITVGLGFGDEGKGATVDYLCREQSVDLVVRYSGGAQAGHNVVLPDGRRHTFAQFGAGTLADVPTYLGPRMIVCPQTIVPEAEHLQSLGVNNPFSMLTIHPDCLVATNYHAQMNRLRELNRGSHRHGSCGLGIGETRSYWLRHGLDAVVARDLKDRQTLVSKLTLIRDRLLIEMQDFKTIDRTIAADLRDSTPGEEADELLRIADPLCLQSMMPTCGTVIFEGAQGALLDEWHGFHPHTTWSTVTGLHAHELAAENGFSDVEVLGITRAYTTRHGAGPFPTRCDDLTSRIVDRGNPTNDWQGTIHAGPLDMVLLRYAATVCKIDGIAVTGFDQIGTKPRICDEYWETANLALPASLKEQEGLTQMLESAKPVIRETTVDEILESLEAIAPVVLTSDGPTHLDRSRYSRSTTNELISGMSA